MKDDLDYILLERRLQNLTRKQRLYKLLKYELSIKGYWRNKPRGNPKKGGLIAQEQIRIASGASISERPK